MLVGNKSDLKHLRAVPTDEARAYAGIIFRTLILAINMAFQIMHHIQIQIYTVDPKVLAYF